MFSFQKTIAFYGSFLLIPFVQSAELVPLVEYCADVDWKGYIGDIVRDTSGNAHDAIVIDQPIRQSHDTPTVAGPDDRSFDFRDDGQAQPNGSITTIEKTLLSNSKIVEAGGFVMEVWFKSSPSEGGNQASLIDYAGTENIRFNHKDNVIEFCVGRVKGKNKQNKVASGQSLSALTDNQWHYVKASFVVTDGSLLDPVYGNMHMVIDGVSRSKYGVQLSNRGDRLRRSIGIGNNPTLLNDSNDFDGLIYRPRVCLGKDEPRSWLWIGVGALIFATVGSGLWKLAMREVEKFKSPEAN